MSVIFHVMDMDFHLCGELAYFSSLYMTRERAGIGAFSVCMHARDADTAGIQIGRVLFPVDHPERMGLIERVTREEGTDTVTAGGTMLSGLVRRRIALPDAFGDDGSGYDSVLADAESVMQHYVSGNVSAPADERRKMACIVLEENQHRGAADVRWQARYEPLEQLLGEIAAYADAGFDIVPDFEKEKFVFRFVPGRDLTGNAGGARVTFSLGMGNAQGVTHTADVSGAKSTAYVGGAGEGAQRVIAVAGSEEAGLERREIFVDALAVADADALSREGERALQDYAAVDSLTCEVTDTGPLRYGRDWDVGDLVNVQGAGTVRQMRVTQVTESIETGRARALTVTFGMPEKGVTALIKRLRSAKIR